MRRTIDADLDASAQRVFERLCMLDDYADWLDIVARVERCPEQAGEHEPAWLVTLRARVGPFARSKRLRMVRTRSVPHSTLRFERIELDGRRHSPWVLDVAIDDRGASCHAAVALSYGGGLWSPVLDVVLGSEIASAVPRLQAAVNR